MLDNLGANFVNLVNLLNIFHVPFQMKTATLPGKAKGRLETARSLGATTGACCGKSLETTATQHSSYAV